MKRLALILPPLLAACGTPTAPGTLAAGSSYLDQIVFNQPMSDLGIAQDGYGRSARFVICRLETCPRSTPKTPDSLPPPPVVEAPQAEPAAAPATTVAKVTDVQPAPEKPQRFVVRFATGKWALTKTSKASLDSAVPYLIAAERVLLRGRTDITGTKALNDRLALKRAETVKQYLLQPKNKIIAPIVIEATGQCCYVASNDTDDDRLLNRRAELEIFALPTKKNEE